VYPTDYPDSKFDEPKPEDKNKPRTDVPPPTFTMGAISNWCAASLSGESFATVSKSRSRSPGKVDEINFTMQDVNHTFRAVTAHGAGSEFVVSAH